MIEVGDLVTVNGEDGAIWEVDMAENAHQIVRIIKNRDGATWRMIGRDDLTLVSKANNGDVLPGFFPARSILD